MPGESKSKTRSGTVGNPIDVDLYVSRWEPTFTKENTHTRFKCEKEVVAFDADGYEHRFTPEFHVSFLCPLNFLEITTSFSSKVVSMKLNHSSSTLKQLMLRENCFTSQILKHLVSTSCQ
jgi:hypothetical protein